MVFHSDHIEKMDFQRKLEEEIQCVICISITADIKELQCCKKPICAKCETSHKRFSVICPTCRKGGYVTGEAHVIKRLMDAFYKKCETCKMVEWKEGATEHECPPAVEEEENLPTCRRIEEIKKKSKGEGLGTTWPENSQTYHEWALVQELTILRFLKDRADGNIPEEISEWPYTSPAYYKNLLDKFLYDPSQSQPAIIFYN